MRCTPKILLALMFSLSIAATNANGQASNQDRDDSIVKKLDEILKRLDTIESRLAKLEANTVNRWRVDERGLLLDAAGKPLGSGALTPSFSNPYVASQLNSH